MAESPPGRMPLRTRILMSVTLGVIGLGAVLYAPYPGLLSLRNQVGVWAFNLGLEPPARLMFEVLAGQDYAPAMGNYGAMVFHGLGDTWRDRPAAVRLITEAAHRGFAPAQYNLGRAMQLGRGVAKDETQARQWFERAAAQDDLFGLMMVVDALEGYQEPGSVDRVQDLLERAAEHGDLEPLFSLAQHTRSRCPQREDHDTCRARQIDYLRQAADRGHLVSQAYLGAELSRGVDSAEGFRWSLKAAEAGQYHAMRRVARSYRSGNGVQVDVERADYWDERVESFPREPTQFVQPRGYDAIYIYRYRRAARMPTPRPREEANARLGLPADYRPAPAPTDPEALRAAIRHQDSLRERYARELAEMVAALLARHPAVDGGLNPAEVRHVHIVRVTDGRTGPLVPVTEHVDYDIYRSQYDAHRSSVVLRQIGDQAAVFVLLSSHAVDWRLELPSGVQPQAVLMASPEVPMIEGLPQAVPLEIESRDLGHRGFLLPPRTEEDWAELERVVQGRFPNAQLHRHHHTRTTLVLIR